MNDTRRPMRISGAVLVVGLTWASVGVARSARQPKVQPGPGEPNWDAVLEQQWGLALRKDLANPVPADGGWCPALFKKAGPGPVTFTPVIALGMETPTNGGWYAAPDDPNKPPADLQNTKKRLWTYAFKHTADDLLAGKHMPVPLKSGATRFDPGDKPFGLWISNDNFGDGGVFTQPELVAALNARLAKQPYKAMIYPNYDKKTGKLVPHSYLIGWEYSTNDDFQDAVTRIDNVGLIGGPATAASTAGSLSEIVAPGAKVVKVAGDFAFTEGPAWDARTNALYFSDIPKNRIYRLDANGKTMMNVADSGQSNGLMFDKQGRLYACEHRGRRLSRRDPDGSVVMLADRYRGKRLNSPNDLWIDSAGGVYFTDPRYGDRSNLEQDKEAVYYLSADDILTRIIDDLVRPNGIALSPDGKTLYVVDHGAALLMAYPLTQPGKVGKGRKLADVPGPDGMSVDAKGDLYVAARDGVRVIAPSGRLIGTIKVPEQPANCTFGDKHRKTLYITARNSLYKIATKRRGWHVHLDGVPKR